MDKALYLRKGICATGIASLIFFLTVGVVSACGMVLAPPPNARIEPIYGAIAFGCFWGGMSSLAIWLLLAYWRERLEFNDEQVIQRGVLCTSTIRFDKIEKVVWRTASAQVFLHARSLRLKIHLTNFEPSDRLWLIRTLQRKVPESVQEGWEIFCVKVAVPLIKHNSGCLDPDDVAITRKRWACYFIPTTLAFVITGIVLSSTLESYRMLIAPVPVLVLWGILHFSTPRQGFGVSRISAEPVTGRFLTFLLIWGCAGLGANFLLMVLKLTVPYTIAWVTVGGAIWFGVLMYQAVQFDRHRLRSDEDRIPAAIKEWVNSFELYEANE